MKIINFFFLLFLLLVGSLKTVAQKPQPISLFNGQDLSGWYTDVPAMDQDSDVINPFIVRDGKLVSLGKPGGHLITLMKLWDYRVNFSYRFIGEPGNCGSLVHVSEMRRLYKMFPQSIEVQMMHENAGDFWCIGENIEVDDMESRRGPKENWGVDGKKSRRIVNLHDNIENPLGEWNHMQIECVGREVKVWLNGVLINYGYNATVDAGQFALQSEGAEVEFKDLYWLPIKKLTRKLKTKRRGY